MQTLVHADIFFFISTICLVVLTLIVGAALVFAVAIMRDVRKISARMAKASEDIEKDIELLRSAVRAEGTKVKGIADLILGFIIRKLTPKVAKRKKVPDESEDL